MIEKENTKTNAENKIVADGKVSHAILCRTYSGGRDLYYGVPDLEGAIVTAVTPRDSVDDYIITIDLQTKNNDRVIIQIRQDRI